MSIVILVLSMLVFAFALGNLFLNTKFKYWEILLIPPTWMAYIFIILLLAGSIWIGSLLGILLCLLSFVLLFPHLEFSVGGLSKKKYTGEGKKITLLDWNTLYFNPGGRDEIAKFIEDKNADFIVLQELWDPVNSERFERTGLLPHNEPGERFTLERVKSYCPKYSNAVIFNDIAVISRYPLEITKEYSCADEEEKFSYMIVKTNIEGKDLYLINLHLPHNLGKGFLFKERIASFNELYKDLEDLKRKEERFIAVGDFNTSRSSRFITHLFNEYTEAVSEHFVGFPITWRSDLPFWKIDFMFYDKRNDFFCLNSHIFKPGYLSDHHGLEAEFIIK